MYYYILVQIYFFNQYQKDVVIGCSPKDGNEFLKFLNDKENCKIKLKYNGTIEIDTLFNFIKKYISPGIITGRDIRIASVFKLRQQL